MSPQQYSIKNDKSFFRKLSKTSNISTKSMVKNKRNQIVK